MGACCGGTSLNPEIEACKSIKELEAFLVKLKNGFPKEKAEIEDYIKDHTKEIKAIRFQDKSEASMKKRVDYLDELEGYVEKYIDALNRFPNLPLKETKEQVQELYNRYTTMYDDTHSICKQAYEGFEKFLKGQKLQ